MSHWWRAHDECVDDPKLLLLSDRTHRAWFNLLCLASANGGSLPAMKVMEVKLRMKAPKIELILRELKDAVLIDETETGLRPHNWDGRQYKSDVSTERVKRFRNSKRNVSETPPETEADTERSEPKGSGAAAPPDPKAELFTRARQVFGKSQGGGLTAKLLKSLGNEDDPKVIARARSRVEEASTMAEPAAWLGRVLAGPAKNRTADGELFQDGII